MSLFFHAIILSRQIRSWISLSVVRNTCKQLASVHPKLMIPSFPFDLHQHSRLHDFTISHVRMSRISRKSLEILSLYTTNNSRSYLRTLRNDGTAIQRVPMTIIFDENIHTFKINVCLFFLSIALDTSLCVCLLLLFIFHYTRCYSMSRFLD